MRSPELIIKRPLLTEKGTFLKETGGRAEEDMGAPESVPPQLLLEVATDANKIEIKFAVEKLWNVNVLKVRTAIVRGKQKRVINGKAILGNEALHLRSGQFREF